MKAMLRFLVVFVVAVALAPEALAREAEYDVVVRKNVMAPMRDGVKLATDLYVPARGEAVIAELDKRAA